MRLGGLGGRRENEVTGQRTQIGREDLRVTGDKPRLSADGRCLERQLAGEAETGQAIDFTDAFCGDVEGPVLHLHRKVGARHQGRNAVGWVPQTGGHAICRNLQTAGGGIISNGKITRQGRATEGRQSAPCGHRKRRRTCAELITARHIRQTAGQS